MEKAKLESMLIDYIDNRLNTVDRQRVEQELVNSPEAYKLYEELKEVMEMMDRASVMQPSVESKNRFSAMLDEEMAASGKTKIIFFQPAFYRAAAAVALLVVGGWIGFIVSDKDKGTVAVDSQRVEKIEAELRMTREMMAKLANDQSASQRIQGVNVALSMTTADDKVVDVLVQTMNEDNNSNVRLAALEALSKFIDEPHVRKALLESLPKQKDPIVQIQLIQLLVKIKEKGVIQDLQNIVDDEGSIKAVKDEAYSGIMKLS